MFLIMIIGLRLYVNINRIVKITIWLSTEHNMKINLRSSICIAKYVKATNINQIYVFMNKSNNQCRAFSAGTSNKHFECLILVKTLNLINLLLQQPTPISIRLEPTIICIKFKVLWETNDYEKFPWWFQRNKLQGHKLWKD